MIIQDNCVVILELRFSSKLFSLRKIYQTIVALDRIRTCYTFPIYNDCFYWKCLYNEDEMELNENRPEPAKKYPRWLTDPFGMVSDWFENNPPEKAANRDAAKIIKTMLKAESVFTIQAMRLFLSDNIGEGGHYFDEIRGNVSGIARGLLTRSPFQELDLGEQAKMQRWVFSTYAGGLLGSAQKSKPLDISIRGIAWSLLANDASKVLSERGQTIDSDWLHNTMGPLMRANKEPKLIGEELSRFVNGDPLVIHEQPLMASKQV